MSYSIPDRQTFRSEQARHNELANIEWSEMKNFYTLTLRKSNHGDGMQAR